MNSIIVSIFFTMIIIFLISLDYKKFYDKIFLFSKVTEEIIEGSYENYLDDSREGEFSVLAHKLNQLSKRFKLNIEKLKEDKSFLKNIISDISHQLRTPLSSLLMINEILIKDKKMKDEVKYDFYKKISMQLSRMEWLVVSLLKYSRLEVGSIIFKNEKFYLYDSIEDTIKYLKEKINEKNIKIIIDDNLEGIIIKGDQKWITEAFINIVKNSIEHSFDNEEINIKTEVNSLFIRIYIKDFGEGIDKKDLPYIFERFRTGKSDIKCESVGIGLSLSKIIIENLGGGISVKSNLKYGTEFVVTFFKN
ncbi:MAG: HAMP domain-containing sensor histidine kinase [Clostridiales bacterium]